MSEDRPTYIPCASGNNAQTDCLLVRRGDLIRLLGHAQMDFTADDFARLCLQGLDLARACGWQDPDYFEMACRRIEKAQQQQRLEFESGRTATGTESITPP